MTINPHTILSNCDCRDAKIRSATDFFIDKTRYIEVLEDHEPNYLVFHRPHGFGKTLFTTTLSAYYDCNEAENFEKNFSGTYISTHKTPLANQFCLLKFNFAELGVEGTAEDFYDAVLRGISDFYRHYSVARVSDVLGKQFSSAAALIENFFASLRTSYRQKLFIIIDEYDAGIRSRLLNPQTGRRHRSSDDQYLVDFFNKIRNATGDSGAVTKVFMTGTTHIGTDCPLFFNLTDSPKFAGLYGFTDEELRQAVPRLLNLPQLGITADDVVKQLQDWYGGYRFSPYSAEAVLNPAACLSYLASLRENGKFPAALLNFSGSQSLEELSRLLNLGAPAFVRSVVTEVLQQRSIPFPAGTLPMLNAYPTGQRREDDILGALTFLGYLTYASDDRYSLAVPNRPVAGLFAAYDRNHIKANTPEKIRHFSKKAPEL